MYARRLILPSLQSRSYLISKPSSFNTFRTYASLDKDTVTNRIIEILKGNDKVDKTKITPSSSFSKDLGLDSLDTVEVVMAIEEEFNIEIPDKAADEIKSVENAVEYISKHPSAA